MSKVSDFIDVHSIGDLQLQALWALEYLSSADKDRFSGTSIANHLIDVCGINTSRQAIQYALGKEKSVVHKNKAGYKIMEFGKNKLRALTDNSRIIFIEAGKPFSAKNIALKDVFNNLEGEILICDPYIDNNTLDVIFKNSDNKKSVKVLTENVIDKPIGMFARHLANLRNEGYKIEIGVYSNSDLHDRYIMDAKTFWLSGNSFNHLGNKESFIVKLGEDIRQSMLATFNHRWKVSNKI
jgi:hypothetical protein